MNLPQTKSSFQERNGEVELNRYNNLPKFSKVLFSILCALGIGVAIYFNFHLSFLQGYVLHSTAYFWLFFALFCSSVFLILPGRKKDRTLPWYDLLAAVLTFSICIYFFTHAWEIGLGAWQCVPLGIIFALVVLEGARRTGGLFYFLVCIILTLYPLYADYMPGILWGRSYELPLLLERLIFLQEGLMGLISKIITQLLVGFLVFAGILVASGAGGFFMNFASALLGRYRGGPAKVAVVASGFFGSLSGSAISNVVATGAFTIPTMKRVGYPARYAGAIEACASTGGMIMPPVMGASAFVMAQLLGIEYVVIVVAAAVPAILYYFGLLMQVDAYAARVGLKGLDREEIPSLKKTLKEGWPYIAVLLFLLWGLLYMRWEKLAPWYASGLMILLSFFRKETMMTPRKIASTLVAIGDLLVRSTAVILPIAFIICGLNLTGVSLSFTAAIINLGGGNIFLVLLLGVIACYIMGMAGLVIVAYVILAVTLAPAVLQIMDLNVLAVHLFIIYYAMLGVITLPVADAAFVAAAMAGSSPMKTAALAMRLGVVIYFIPFFFVFNPALILQGSFLAILWLFPLCLVGICLIAGGCEGYLVKIGRVELWARPLLIISGLLIGFPEWRTTIIGTILALFIAAIMWIRKRKLLLEKG